MIKIIKESDDETDDSQNEESEEETDDSQNESMTEEHYMIVYKHSKMPNKATEKCYVQEIDEVIKEIARKYGLC